MDKLHLPLVISLIGFLLMSIISTSKLILPVYGFGLDVHKQTTSDVLSFLKPEILDQINQGHNEADDLIGGHQFNPEYHFDACNFREGVGHINQEYTTRVVPNLDPKGFGVVLHASMDFYAHSNWVELGKSNIIDNGDGLWNPMTPGANIGGVIVLEGDTIKNDIKNENFLSYPSTIDLSNPKVPMVSFGEGEKLPGLISGILPFPYSAFQNRCPIGSPGHWDNFLFYNIIQLPANEPGLCKDKAGRSGYGGEVYF